MDRPLRRHQFLDASIDLPEHLTEAQLDGRACIRCGDEHAPKRPVEAWSEQSAQLFGCIDIQACERHQPEHLRVRKDSP
jgi:hypothetical protein